MEPNAKLAASHATKSRLYKAAAFFVWTLLATGCFLGASWIHSKAGNVGFVESMLYIGGIITAGTVSIGVFSGLLSLGCWLYDQADKEAYFAEECEE